jgi:hypothetical protein
MNTADVTGGKSIAVSSQSISGVSAVFPLVAFYDIHGRKKEVLIFYFILNTTLDNDLVIEYKSRIPQSSVICILR